MNSVNLIGRLTKDVEVRSFSETQTSVCRFSIAIDRGKDKEGKSRGTDFPNILCFGKTAENMERYTSKGMLLGIQGKIQTGNYEKDGKKFYTTEVLAERIEYLSFPKENEEKPSKNESFDENPYPSFGMLTDDDIPF